jgi:hypothetical protein
MFDIKNFIKNYEERHPVALAVAEGIRPCYGCKDVMLWARWHLAQLQRFAVPSEIADAVENLERIVAHEKMTKTLKTNG